MAHSQIGAIGGGFNYGFNPGLQGKFNHFFNDYNNNMPGLIHGIKQLSKTSCHGFGFNVFCSGFNKSRTGLTLLLGFEYQRNGWKRSAEFSHRVSQEFKFSQKSHNFYCDFGTDLVYMNISFTLGIAFNRTYLDVYHKYPTGNYGFSLDNPFNGSFYSSFLTLPVGIKISPFVLPFIRFPISIQYILPIIGNESILQDPLSSNLISTNNNNYFPTSYSGSGNFKIKDLSGFSFRFGFQAFIPFKK